MEALGGRVVIEDFARAFVEHVLEGPQLLIRDGGAVQALGAVVPDAVVLALAGGALPGAVRVAEENLEVEMGGELRVLGHFFALVVGQREAQLRGELAEFALEGRAHAGGVFVGQVAEQREAGRAFDEHAERALALDPAYDYAHHVLGRWHYEVATLGATTRFFVRLIYGGLPPASTAEAVRHLRRAIALSPDLPSHRVELGFSLLADGQRDLARETLTQALALPKREKYDDEAWRRAREALAKL